MVTKFHALLPLKRVLSKRKDQLPCRDRYFENAKTLSAIIAD
jgi:hypothetical protein